jgi:cystathionine beta-lyase/cystathionine gamma-synthase
MKSDYAFETLAIHAGQPADPSTGAVMTPIYQTATYRQEGVGRHKGFDYSRTLNPTRSALEACLAELEAGEAGFAFASGMSAIDAVLRLFSPGDHVLAANDLYGGTYRLFERVYANHGLSFTYAPADRAEAFLAQVQSNTRLIWLESPTNPMLTLCDISSICQGARHARSHPLVCVDNTFATPYLQRPLTFGADVVVHSTTKYLGGHSDVVGGAAIVKDHGTAERVGFIQNAVGAVPSPLDCFLVLRGIKTLAVRMDRHASNAKSVASFLEAHPSVERVIYPGLASHPQAELARQQMRNAGGMLSFTPRGGAEKARKVVEATRVFALAESLGGVESLIELPAAMTHASTGGSPLRVEEDLIRVSVGLEAVDDLIADLDQALA